METTQLTQSDTTSVILKKDVVEDSRDLIKRRDWTITCFDTTDTRLNEFVNLINCKKVIGLEICPTTKKQHLQMYFRWNNARTWKAIKKDFPDCHIEPARRGITPNVIYCTKENTIINDWPELLEKEYDGEDLPNENQLYPWQHTLLDILKTKPNDRDIYWFYDEIGNVGKSKFGKYLWFKNKTTLCFTTATKSADILTSAENHYKTYIFDFPRSLGEFCPYNAIEQLKNGFITDSKLKKKCRTLAFNPPHIIIFSNQLPRLDKLSMDRWKIYHINHSKTAVKWETETIQNLELNDLL